MILVAVLGSESPVRIMFRGRVVDSEVDSPDWACRARPPSASPTVTNPLPVRATVTVTVTVTQATSSTLPAAAAEPATVTVAWPAGPLTQSH